MQWEKVPRVEEPWAANWPPETPRRLDYEVIPVDEIPRRNARKYPDAPAIYFEGFRMTHAELDRAIERFAGGLAGAGLQRGDVVLIDLPNVPQFVVAFYGVLRAGGVPNPVIPLNRYAEIVHQANDSKAKALVILDALYEQELHGKDLDRMETLRFVVLTGLAEYLPPVKRALGTLLGKVPRMKRWPDRVGDVPFLAFQDLLAAGRGAALPERKVDPLVDPACLVYTGGTTGTPKGVVLTHFNLLANCQQALSWTLTQVPELADTAGRGGMVVVLPLAHLFALSIAMNVGLYFGYKLLLFPRPPAKISDVLKVIAKEGATFCPGVPTLWNRINQDPASAKYRGKMPGFAACLSGAAPLPLDVRVKFEALTGARIVEGYGMSEASPLVTANPFNRPRENTVGFPVADTWVKVVDLDTGEPLPPCPREEPYCSERCGPREEKSHVGEICACGPQIMKGYLNRPGETAAVLRVDEEGVTWYHTSDVGCLDAGGYLRVKDRKRDMIKYKGHSVFPREVEDLLYQYKPVLEVGVYGVRVPDPEVGEEVRAAVSLKPEFRGKVTAEDVLAWCRENVAWYKIPRQVRVVDELPKSLVGKVLRRKLRDAG
ncbi:MAG: long-chain fatty acid--CoA ligase [Promethearchaeota archaeon]